ncbi:hypothetical protein TMatcc_008314 [Talaromyces marneffei ATCC 18224]|uniref:Zinc finger FYVE domain-containing protein 19 n=2 Tax=Talaromyces marneffei TaxID=37727 RepID=B6QMG0_TALMQ|nr:conserved hypothetical protein [Talaromyces marneffei ATCC 18224]KAE8550298.1 hypothetical protein EYB25_006522 [Talaromyces marneffei]
MADVPHNEDKRLLERLNSLKPSTVQLDRQRNVVLNTPSSLDPFEGLENSGSLFPAAPSRSKLDGLSTGSLFAEDDIISPESLMDGDAIEDLLASLSNNNTRISETAATQIGDKTGNDESQTRELLSDAYGFIQQASGTEPDPSINSPSHVNFKKGKEDDIPDFLKDIDSSNEEDDESDEEKEEAEAAKYVENLLKEIAENPPPASPIEDSSTPSPKENVDGDEDDLSSRLAALSLPSAPNTQPGNRPKRNDDETPSCCCICYDTAKLKCMDCEGDQLFCVRCWWEMHLDDEGDSGHKAVKFEDGS